MNFEKNLTLFKLESYNSSRMFLANGLIFVRCVHFIGEKLFVKCVRILCAFQLNHDDSENMNSESIVLQLNGIMKLDRPFLCRFLIIFNQNAYPNQ